MLNKIIITAVFIISVVLPLNSQAQETVRLAVGEWQPYITEKVEGKGLLSQIVSAAYKEVGVKVEYHFFSWKRAMFYVEKGSYDGSIGWVKSTEREKRVDYSDPIGETASVFFHLKTLPFHWDDSDDLQGYDISATYGYYELEKLRGLVEPGKDYRIQSHNTELDSLKLLLNKRVDLFLCSRAVGLSLLRSNFTPAQAAQVTYHPQPFFTENVHAIFNKQSAKSQRLKELLNTGLQVIRDNGKFDALIKNYIENSKSEKLGDLSAVFNSYFSRTFTSK